MKKLISILTVSVMTAALLSGCKAEQTPVPVNPDVPVAVVSETDTSGTDADKKYYTFTYSISDDAIESFAVKIRDAFLNGDKKTIADNANFPLRIGDKKFENSDELLAADFDSIFSDRWKSDLKTETCTAMGFNGEGFMLADGLVWVFDVQNDDGTSRLLVWSVNL